MTRYITSEIVDAYNAYMEEVIDHDFVGTPILRKNTYPHSEGVSEILSFAAGYHAAKLVRVAEITGV